MTKFTRCQQSSRVLQAVRIMPPSLVVVAWASLRTPKVAREFLGNGVSGVRGIAPELPVVVVGGKDDGKVRPKLYFWMIVNSLGVNRSRKVGSHDKPSLVRISTILVENCFLFRKRSKDVQTNFMPP